MTGIGPVTVRQPRVRDRAGDAGERIRFSPNILPRYARRTKSLEALIPILYLKGVSTGDFEEALSALVGADAPGLSASTIDGPAGPVHYPVREDDWIDGACPRSSLGRLSLEDALTAEMTGCCCTCAVMTFALICSNWAFRSGWFVPSSALRLDWRENPSFTNSLRTVSALIGCPISVRVAASFSMLFDTQIKGRMGSPSVAGATRRSSAGTSPGSFSQTARRPPPAQRTRPFGSGFASISSSPRLIVERASPVIFDTTARPPQPAVRTSPAANSRRPRSSS